MGPSGASDGLRAAVLGFMLRDDRWALAVGLYERYRGVDVFVPQHLGETLDRALCTATALVVSSNRAIRTASVRDSKASFIRIGRTPHATDADCRPSTRRLGCSPAIMPDFPGSTRLEIDRLMRSRRQNAPNF